MKERFNLKYVPANAIKNKNIFLEEYYSGVDADIYIGEKYCDYVASIQYTLQEQLNPIYGYASYVYDDVAIGNRIVVGSIKIPIGNYEKILIDFTGVTDNGLTPISIDRNEAPTWVSNIKPLARNSYLHVVKEIYDSGRILTDEELSRAYSTLDIPKTKNNDENKPELKRIVVNHKPKYDIETEPFFKEKYSDQSFNEEIDTGTYRKNYKDIRIIIGGKYSKTLENVMLRSLDTALSPDGQPLYDVIQFIARNLEEKTISDI